MFAATVPAGLTDAIQGTHIYTYDALGRRVSKTVDDNGTTTTTLLVCIGQQVVCEYVGASPTVASPDQRYVYGSYVDEPILKAGKFAGGSTGVVYYSRNAQYSVGALTDSGGNVVERYAYDAYGKMTIFDGSSTVITASAYNNPYTYTARRTDAESGLMYFRARMYDAKLGRFISRDPLGFVDGLSLYRGYFVPGGVDPSGTVCAKTCDKDPKMKKWPKCPDKFIDNQKDAIKELIAKGNKHDGDKDGKPDRPANDQLSDKITQLGPKTKADKVCPNSPGQHINVYHKNKPVAPNDPKNLKKKLINTIWYCKCCDDSSGTATARNEWKVSGKHNRDL